jgi:hypothetical protein
MAAGRRKPKDPDDLSDRKHRRGFPMRVYCEHGALNSKIRAWAGARRIELVHFPYDPNSHTRAIPIIAEPSAAQIKDLNLPIEDLPGAIEDYKPSRFHSQIQSIVGQQHRRDALHVDSAFKSDCLAFITRDSDILKHKAELTNLLGIRFFNPDDDLGELELFLDGPPS